MAEVKSSHLPAFASVTTLFFTWGFVTSNNDPLIAALKASFSLSYTEALLTQLVFFAAYGFVSIPAAALINRVGAVRWFTFGRVVDAVPGERFSLTIHFGPIPISLWTYDFAPSSGGGCEVTESWTDHRPAAFRALFRPFFGDRTRRNLAGIHTTLLRLKSAAEA